jgi:hypothetical protein
MSFSQADLALCAARTRQLAERLSDRDRDQLIAEWGELIDELDSHRTNAEVTLVDFRARIEERLADPVAP